MNVYELLYLIWLIIIVFYLQQSGLILMVVISLVWLVGKHIKRLFRQRDKKATGGYTEVRQEAIAETEKSGDNEVKEETQNETKQDMEKHEGIEMETDMETKDDDTKAEMANNEKQEDSEGKGEGRTSYIPKEEDMVFVTLFYSLP